MENGKIFTPEWALENCPVAQCRFGAEHIPEVAECVSEGQVEDFTPEDVMDRIAVWRETNYTLIDCPRLSHIIEKYGLK